MSGQFQPPLPSIPPPPLPPQLCQPPPPPPEDASSVDDFRQYPSTCQALNANFGPTPQWANCQLSSANQAGFRPIHPTPWGFPHPPQPMFQQPAYQTEPAYSHGFNAPQHEQSAPYWPPYQQHYPPDYQAYPPFGVHAQTMENRDGLPGFDVTSQGTSGDFIYQQLDTFTQRPQQDNYQIYHQPSVQYKQLNPVFSAPAPLEEGELTPDSTLAAKNSVIEEVEDDDDWQMCKLCKVPFEDEAAFNRHCRGLNHTQKLLSHEKNAGRIEGDLEPPPEDEVDLELLRKKANDPNKRDILPSEIGGATFDKRWFCSDCSCSCSGEDAFKSHMVGKRHAKTMKVKEAVGLKIRLPTNKKEPLPVEVPSMVPTDAVDTNRRAQIQSKVDFMKEPLIGLKYVVEYISNLQPSRYVCNLCEAKCDANTILPHLIGFKHRLKFLKEVRCDIYAEVQLCADSKQSQSELLNVRCREIEAEHGRDAICQRREIIGKSAQSAISCKKATPPGYQPNVGDKNVKNGFFGSSATLREDEEISEAKMGMFMPENSPALKNDQNCRGFRPKPSQKLGPQIGSKRRHSSSSSDGSDFKHEKPSEDRRRPVWERHNEGLAPDDVGRARGTSNERKSCDKNGPVDGMGRNSPSSTIDRQSYDEISSNLVQNYDSFRNSLTPRDEIRPLASDQQPSVLKLLLQALVTTSVKKDTPDAAKLSTALTNAILKASQQKSVSQPSTSEKSFSRAPSTGQNFAPSSSNRNFTDFVNSQQNGTYAAPGLSSRPDFCTSTPIQPGLDSHRQIDNYAGPGRSLNVNLDRADRLEKIDGFTTNHRQRENFTRLPQHGQTQEALGGLYDVRNPWAGPKFNSNGQSTSGGGGASGFVTSKAELSGNASNAAKLQSVKPKKLGSSYYR